MTPSRASVLLFVLFGCRPTTTALVEQPDGAFPQRASATTTGQEAGTAAPEREALSGAIGVVIGFDEACARLVDQSVVCWGIDYRSLRGASQVDGARVRAMPEKVSELEGAVSFSFGSSHCAVG